MKKTLFILAMLLPLLSCSKDEDAADTYLVVEGWIENGAAPMVMVSETIGITTGEYISPKDMVEHVSKWAKVTLSDGEKTEILTGIADAGYFPPYVFTSSRIKGEVGKTYTLEVEYKDYKAKATTTIPRPVPIDTLYVREVSYGARMDSTCVVMCGFRDPKGEENFYKIMAMDTSQDNHYHACSITCTPDDVMGDYTEIPFVNILRLMDAALWPNLKLDHEIKVKLCAMDKTTYNYWRDFEAQKNNSSFGLSFRVGSLRSNMDGALGYFAGYGVAGEKSLLLKDPNAEE